MEALLCMKLGDPAEPPNSSENLALSISTSHPIPQLDSPTSVRVRVKATNLNFALQILGKYQEKFPLPFVLASDFSGIVESIRPNVTKFKVGDLVCGFGSVGFFTQFIVADENDFFLYKTDQQAVTVERMQLCTARHSVPRVTFTVMATRRMRVFKQWMKLQGIDCSDALDLIEEEEGNDGVLVRALCDLHEGDLVATIPKQSCLTMKTSVARHVIEDAGLHGYLGLSVALMYEKSLGPRSPWFGYLQLLAQFGEPIPLLWSFQELDSLLSGTELHKIVKEDRALINEDWKECISPLLDSTPIDLNSDAFSIDQYLIAKSLIASRSFEIDEYHGFGMVPLADLFNHKTGAEDVHFTSVSSHCDSDNDSDESNGYDENANDSDRDLQSQNMGDNPAVLQMIIVKDVKAGAEVFNTYGSLGNAAFLHRYGFTEPDNPYDIVNVDLELVHRWSTSLFSALYSRTRVSLWRKLDYSGCVGQNSEYFEISSEGEPEIELLILLHIMLLPEEAYHDLDLKLSIAVTSETSTGIILLGKGNITLDKDLRESLYGSRSLEDDIEALKRCCPIKERKLYHSLMLRISEKRILEKLRAYASAGTGPLINSVRAAKRKKLKIK